MKCFFIQSMVVLISLLFILSCADTDVNADAIWNKEVIPLYLNREANQKSEECVKECVDIWNEALQGRVSFEYAGRNRAGLRRDGKNTISFVVNWPAGIKQTYIGYTYNWKRKGVIRESDILFNQYLYKFTVHPEKVPQGYFYLKTILLHEMGHTLGLDHTDDELSLMQPLFQSEQTLQLDFVDEGTAAAACSLYSQQGKRI